MLAIQFLPVATSLLLLAAHFFRSGSLVMTALPILLVGLLAVRRTRAAHLLQVVLVLGAVEWLRTLRSLSAMRAAQGESAERMAAILGAVAAFTALSALLLRTRRARAWFRGLP